MLNITEAKELVEKTLSEIPEKDQPNNLYEPIRYILSLGGKRVRPLLTLLGCFAYSDDYKKALHPSIAVELFHNFTLVHDDIMDQAPLRRGKKTIHQKWSESIGILSGDATLVLAYQNLIKGLNPELFIKIFSRFNEIALEVCEGQQLDMDFELISQVTEEEYISMISLKTAVLLGFSFEMGALIGGASQADAEKMFWFGKNIGISFQLKDDFLDVYGDPEKFGKKKGGDILANKKTILFIEALQRASPTQKESLLKLYSAGGEQVKKVDEVTQIFDELNVKACVFDLIEKYYRLGISELHSTSIQKDKKDFLIQFVNDLGNRVS